MNAPRPWSAMQLTLDQVSCDRGGRRILTDVSLTAKPGELWAIRGNNGAGKSTLLRLIAGFLPLTSGKIDLSGQLDADRPLGAHCHYVGHLDALKPSLSVRETLDLWRATFGVGDLSLETALEAFDIGHLIDLPAGYLSAGQRRRVGLARLLISKRPIWLLDEPTSALDHGSEALLGGILEQHLGAGGMILAATHLDLPVKARYIKSLSLRRRHVTLDAEEATLDDQWRALESEDR